MFIYINKKIIIFLTFYKDPALFKLGFDADSVQCDWNLDHALAPMSPSAYKLDSKNKNENENIY